MEFDLYKKLGAYHWGWYQTNPVYRAHVDKLTAWITETEILDAGCGDGLIASKLAEAGKIVHGIDTSMEGIDFARAKNVNAWYGSVYEIPYPVFAFDAVLMADVIEHLDFPEVALVEALRVTRNFLYLTTPDKSVSKNDNPYHVREYTEAELVEFVTGWGFTLVNSFTDYGIVYAKFQRP